MSFNPKPKYITVSSDINIKDFFEYKEMYVTRPPYQRKSVWSKKKKQSLIDSLFRRYYIPKLVIREVRLSDTQTVNEIIDGQQRITTVQEFFDNQYPLPKSLFDFCQQCLREEKPENEARVSWSDYQADHVIPHAKGGKTILENAELLCSYHNQSKGTSINEST